MPIPILHQIKVALGNLNPHDVRALAERPVTLGILALDEAVWARMAAFLIPEAVSEAKAREAGRQILRMASEEDFDRCEVGLSEQGLPHPAHFYRFDPHNPGAVVAPILDDNEELWLPLARCFLPFREPAIERIIWKICKENALFTVATAMPNIVPSLISAPWAVGEFASDTAFLTMNQVRMAFLIAGASDSEIGYRSQKAQIGSIVAAAFGWRALAREAVSKVPAGAGLVSKGLIAFAGTYTIGKGLDRLSRLGRGLTREEKKQYYEQALERGRTVVQEIVDRVKRRRVAVIHSA